MTTDHIYLYATILCFGLGALIAGFGVVRSMIETRRLAPGTLAHLQAEPSHRSTLGPAETWSSRRPWPWLLATVLFCAGTVLSWLSLGPSQDLLELSALVLAVAFVNLFAQLGNYACLTISYQSIDVQRGSRRSIVEWKDAAEVSLTSDLSGFEAKSESTLASVDLRPFSATARMTIARSLLAYASLRGVPVVSTSPLEKTKASRATLTVAHYLYVVLAIASGVLIREQINMLGDRNVLGLRCSANSAYLHQKYSTADKPGCVVLRVDDGTGAAKAGLRAGDLIVSLNGIPITSGPQFTAVFGRYGGKHEKYRVVRAGAEKTFDVTLGAPGKAPVEDTKDPIFYYLRARGGENRGATLSDFNRGIELEPNFDLALAYRGVYWASSGNDGFGLKDVEAAVAMDPNDTEALRSRANVYNIAHRYTESTKDIDAAWKLDGCDGGFKKYNYDCYSDSLLRVDVLGGTGKLADAGNEAVRAISYYDAEADGFYRAALYFNLAQDQRNARIYATQFLALSTLNTPKPEIEDMRKILSDAGSTDGPTPEPKTQVQTGFIERTSDTTANSGVTTISNFRITAERSGSLAPPPALTAVGSDAQQFWVYFEYSNADPQKGVTWNWHQGPTGFQAGVVPIGGATNGRVWIVLKNNSVGKPVTGMLDVIVADTQRYTTAVSFFDEPYLGAGNFYYDQAATQPVLFYDGSKPVYLGLGYSHMPADGRITWQAEMAGTPIGSGDYHTTVADGTAVIQLKPPTGMTGVIAMHLDAGPKTSRTAWVAVAPPDVVKNPPFQSFVNGDGLHSSFSDEKSAADTSLEISFKLNGVHVPDGSELKMQWARNAKPYVRANHVAGSGLDSFYSPWPDEYRSDHTPGEVELTLLYNDRPVFAKVWVIVP